MFEYFKEEKLLKNIINKVKKNGEYELTGLDKLELGNIDNVLDRLRNKGVDVSITERTYWINSYGDMKKILTKDILLKIK